MPAAAIAARLFGRIKRGVRAADQRRHFFARQQGRGTEAHGDLQFPGRRPKARRFDGLPRPFQGPDGFVGFGSRQHYGHLFTAVTGDEIALAGRFSQDPRGAAEHFVAGLVAVGVVESLEVVDVAKDQREWPAAPLEFVEVCRHFVVEGPAVRQAGQNVRTGLSGFQIHEPGLFIELNFHGAELRLHRLVGRDQLLNGRDHALRLGNPVRGQFLIDLFNPAAVLADVGRHMAGQVFQPREDFLGHALLFRHRRGTAAEALEQPTGASPAGNHDDPKCQIAKHLKHNLNRFRGPFPPNPRTTRVCARPIAPTTSAQRRIGSTFA